MALGKTAKSILKWAVYSFVLLLLYTLQASPALFSIHGIKPVFVIPMAVSVALFENEAGAGAFGLAAGLLWDFSAGKLFGFYGMALMVCCVCISLIWGYGSSAVSFGKLMLVLIYTVLFSGPIYLLTRLIATHLNPVLRA